LIFQRARKLNEGEKLPIKDHAYGVKIDKQKKKGLPADSPFFI